VCGRGRKADVEPRRLLVDMVKFTPHVMVSAGVCVGGNGHLHFVDKAKVNAAYYLEKKLLPRLVEDCEQLLPNNFILQQDHSPAHMARVTQDWLKSNCSDFITKDEWPPNSPDLNPMDYHVWVGEGAMLESYQHLQPKPQTELKDALQLIWSALPQRFIDSAVNDFRRRLQACVSANGGDFEHKI